MRILDLILFEIRTGTWFHRSISTRSSKKSWFYASLSHPSSIFWIYPFSYDILQLAETYSWRYLESLVNIVQCTLQLKQDLCKTICIFLGIFGFCYLASLNFKLWSLKLEKQRFFTRFPNCYQYNILQKLQPVKYFNTALWSTHIWICLVRKNPDF